MSHNMEKDGQEVGSSSEYLPQLQAELDSIDPSFTHAKKLVEDEITRVKSGKTAKEPKKFIEVHNMTPVKVSVNILLPTKEHPKFNFVGKLLGPGGNSLKRLQQETQTRMAIQGRGSMKDKRKEDELREEGGAKYAHLVEDLHLKIDAFAPAEEAHSRISNAIRLIQPYLVPELNDDISHAQMTQIRGRNEAYSNGIGSGVGMASLAKGGGAYYSRDLPGGSRGYDDYSAPEPRSRDPYAAVRGDPYERGDARVSARESYYDYAPPAVEPSRERYGGDYGQSRQSWGGQGNGYQGGSGYQSGGSGYSSGAGYGKAPPASRGARSAGADRSHPYGRGGGRSGGY